jgi:putative thioredoxin
MSDDNLPIYEGKQDNFSTLVLDNSFKGPVFAYYWAEKAAPCHRFFPLLTGLVKAYQGQFLLVTINTDTQASLCQQQGVNSVPTLHFFYQGKKVKQWHGLQSESELRSSLSEYLSKESDKVLVAALQKYKQGEIEEALSMLAKTAMDDLDNYRIPVTLAKLLMAQSRHDEAATLLESLPESLKKQKEVTLLLAHQRFIQIAKTAPDKRVLEDKYKQNRLDKQERYQYAAVCLLDDNVEIALEQLLILFKEDKADSIQQGILAIFDILGEDSALAQKYRSILFNLLY